MRKYSEIFDECFPFYFSIGMSSAEYWDGDNSLPQLFRKAYVMKQEQQNHEAWLHGLYFYDAIVSAMSHMSSNKNSHKSYTAKPFSFTEREIEEEKQAKVEEAQAQAEVWMRNWAAATQKMFKNK